MPRFSHLISTTDVLVKWIQIAGSEALVGNSANEALRDVSWACALHVSSTRPPMLLTHATLLIVRVALSLVIILVV